MSALLPQALSDINILRIKTVKSNVVQNKMKINKPTMVKITSASFVIVMPELSSL